MSIIVKGHDGGVLRRFRLPQTGPSVLPTLGAGALCDPEGFTVTLLTGNLAEGTYEFTPTSGVAQSSAQAGAELGRKVPMSSHNPQAAYPSVPPPVAKRRKPASNLPPSSIALPTNVRQLQQPDSRSLPCFHVDRDDNDAPHVIPALLAHPAFGMCLQLINNTSSLPPKEFVQLAQRLCATLRPYHDEETLATGVLPVMQALLRNLGAVQPTVLGTGTGAKTDPIDDGALLCNPDLGPMCSVQLTILRLELKVPGNSADGLIQVLAYQKLNYADVVSKLGDATITPDVKLNILRSEATLAKVARVLWGVREASAVLHRFFQDPPSDLQPINTLPAYPIPYLLRSLLATPPEHLYDDKLLWRGMYDSSRGVGGASSSAQQQPQQQVSGSAQPSGSAQQSGGSSGGDPIPVVLKFAERYGLEVHRQWAEAGAAVPLIDALCIADALRTPDASGSFSNSYGYSCVGMPDLDKEGYVMVSLLPDEERCSAKERALEMLDKVPRDTVHGDLRTVNAMVGPGGQLLFVDFGWAGRAGEARYPLDLNQALFSSNGAEPGGLITAQHDRLMVASW